MSREPTATLPAWRRYFSLILFSLLIIGIALWLSVGVGGYFMKGILQQQYIKTTHGLAYSASEIDPHIAKIQSEYEELINKAKEHNPEGIYERIHAGDYSYPTLTEDSLGQYSIETTIIYATPGEAETAYDSILLSFQDKGYVVPPELLMGDDNFAEMVRMINAADEKSTISPGEDHIVLSAGPSKDKGRITFFYKSPELPLEGIPSYENPQEYTVKEYDSLQEQIISGELDLCDFEPNGAVGGWYKEYSCEKDYL